jgi:hypothetical protein
MERMCEVGTGLMVCIMKRTKAITDHPSKHKRQNIHKNEVAFFVSQDLQTQQRWETSKLHWQIAYANKMLHKLNKRMRHDSRLHGFCSEFPAISISDPRCAAWSVFRVCPQQLNTNPLAITEKCPHCHVDVIQKRAVGTERCVQTCSNIIQIRLTYFKPDVMSQQRYFSQNSERPGFESW